MKKLSSNIGRNLYSLECNSTINERQIINSFTGICEGNVFLFNHINELNNRSLYLFLQLSSELYQNILKKSSKFEYFDMKYSINNPNEIHLFSTISKVNLKEFSKLKSDLFVHYRILKLTKPDSNHLFRSHLIESGYHHANELSNRFINYLTYTINQSITDYFSTDGLIKSHMDLNPFLIQMLIKYSRMNRQSNSYEDEEESLYRGLMILSKCLNKEDKECFQSLIWRKKNSFKETIPKSLPLENLPIDNRYLNERIWNISDGFELSLNQFHLNSNQKILEKLFQFNSLIENHRRILIVGKTQFGKSLLIKTFVKAKSYLNPKQIYHHLMLQLWSAEDLFSKFNQDKGIFEQGILPNLVNQAKEELYLHLDGFNLPDLSSIENFILNVTNGYVFWELENVNNLSPLFLSSCVMIDINEPIWTWRDLIQSNISMDNREDLSEELEKVLFDYIGKIELYPIKDKSMIKVSFLSKIEMSLSLLKPFIKNEKCHLVDLRPLVEYTLYWSFITHVDLQFKKQFEEWWKQTFNNIPKEKNLSDWMYDIDSHQFVLWSDTIPAFNPLPHQGIPMNIFVHTPYTMALSYIVSSLIENDRPVLLIGERGIGKSSLISDRLKSTCGGDISDVFYITINCNSETDGLSVYERLEEQFQWKHSSYYTTKGNRKMFCFIDDLNLAKIDRYQSQSLVQLLRQHIDSNGLYSPSTSQWQNLSNITYIVTSNNEQTFSKFSRLLKCFHIIEMDMPNEEELVSIFLKLLNRHLIGDNGETQINVKDSNENPVRVSTGKSSSTTTITDPTTTTAIVLKEKLSTQALKRLEYLRLILEKIVHATIELNQRMRNLYQKTSQRIHYVFSMKQLTQLFRNFSISLTPDSSIDDILYLWHHETYWLYERRLLDSIDQQRYQQLYQTIVKKYFTNMINEQQALFKSNQLFSNLQVTESGS